jgi:hypothetical protein
MCADATRQIFHPGDAKPEKFGVISMKAAESVWSRIQMEARGVTSLLPIHAGSI